MSDAAAYSYVSMRDAIADAGLDEAQVSNPRTGLSRRLRWWLQLLAGGDRRRAARARRAQGRPVHGAAHDVLDRVGQPRHRVQDQGRQLFDQRGLRDLGALHRAAADLIRHGAQDIVFAGGGEDLDWTMTVMFDAMGALSSAFNDTPEKASRPYDADRDGFVIAGGGGMLVLEDWDHAVARGARIHAELVGYGVTSDGADMVAPSGEGAVRCMRMAMQGLEHRKVDYLNTHGTSTPLGDVTELGAVREVFGADVPPLSSTKALSGHSLGAASVHEAIYSLLMMRDGFIAGSANIEKLDERAEGFPIVRESRDAQLDLVMSNSFGFGGTNATLVFARP